MELNKKYKSILDNAGINTKLRLSHFMAQIEHESHLKPISESLYYRTVEQAKKTFKTPFENKTDEFISGYLKNSEKMANYVYQHRMGNAGERTGMGWKYRGRGFIQITGFNNYKALTEATGIDYVNNPDLLLNEADSMLSAIWYWNMIDGNKYADKDDITTITKKINGGTNGITSRKALLSKYKKIFK
jgi:putative chitinase